MNTEDQDSHPDLAGLEELLREVGARHEPSIKLRREVERAVHGEWHAMLAERRRRRNVLWGMAACVALATPLGIFALRHLNPAEPIATLARIEGQPLSSVDNKGWNVRRVGQQLRVGESLQTDERSRASLTFPRGLSIRLDHNTRIRLAAADRIRLDAGALYIDSPPGAANAAPLLLETALGTVQHVGTQYQVRTQADAMEVSVREGRVLIRNRSRTHTGDAGESIRVTARGELLRRPVAAHDPLWQWAAEAAPRFSIDKQTLAAFLSWFSRETGRPIVYASPQAQTAAQNLILRGSIEGLDLDTALTTVLSTTQLRRYSIDADSIGVALAAPIDSKALARPMP